MSTREVGTGDVTAAAERFLERRPRVVDPTVIPVRSGYELTTEDLVWFAESLLDEERVRRASRCARDAEGEVKP